MDCGGTRSASVSSAGRARRRDGERAVVADRVAGGQRARFEREDLSRVGGELLARPVLAGQRPVHDPRGERRGGLPSCHVGITCCWIPATSQPVLPSTGFTRFHTSSKASAVSTAFMPQWVTLRMILVRRRSLLPASRTRFA